MDSRENPVSALLVAKAEEHGTLLEADKTALRELPFTLKTVDAGEDVVRQGDKPDRAVFVWSGMLSRYHTLANGDRQYLCLHIPGDMPDVQSLFLQVMDHSVCALDQAEIAMFKHDAIRKVFLDRPGVAFAFWRLTLVDAAIFREAVTNNSARPPAARLAHFCCEVYERARQAGLTGGASCSFPLTQSQLGQALGMSHISVHRALQTLRKGGLLEVGRGQLQIRNWSALARAAAFDPTYLHLAKDSATSRMTFRRRR
jgi:CRP-like cAMP-binding protein